MNTTKTDIIEKAIAQFEDSTATKRNALLQFAGSLAISEANNMLSAIHADKNFKPNGIKQRSSKCFTNQDTCSTYCPE